MTTTEAFNYLLSDRGRFVSCFPRRETANIYASRFGKGKLSEETISKVLRRAGFKEQTKNWEV
jgi:hypothetical protein